MPASGPKPLPAIGFLTVIEHEDHNLFGGYLVLNASGRPLEFHCTMPVRANRAQEILYGPTLRPYLYGEQIGVTLIGKAKTEPMFVCTDVEDAMGLRELIKTPVVFIAGRTDADESAGGFARIDGRHETAPAPKSLRAFSFDNIHAAVSLSHAEDQQKIIDLWAPHAGNVDLAEPFARIREAIEETQRSGTR